MYILHRASNYVKVAELNLRKRLIRKSIEKAMMMMFQNVFYTTNALVNSTQTTLDVGCIYDINLKFNYINISKRHHSNTTRTHKNRGTKRRDFN